MAKNKTEFVCGECGHDTAKWVGQCPNCGAWNTLKEMKVSAPSVNKRSSWTGERAAVKNITEVSGENKIKFSTQVSEFDRSLDGGLAKGSIILLGGEPGIGKSTLLLQVMLGLNSKMPVLYVAGEESVNQIADRAFRIGGKNASLPVLSEIDVDKIVETILETKAELIVIDSIQTIYDPKVESAPGSVSQVRECAARLTMLAKQNNITIILVGHVTKDGNIAGPRVLEHLVDAVLYFEGDGKSNFRVVRSFKNRFGSINEIGTFLMEETGLTSITNPSVLFLEQHDQEPGSCIFVTQEGKRSLLLEVQALVDEKTQAHPRTLSIGVNYERVSMLVAILQKKTSVKMSDQNVYVNIVGGLKITDTATDLAIGVALLSSVINQSIEEKTVIIGEIGLTGEIRCVPNMESRLSEAMRNGFDKAIIPDGKYKVPAGMSVKKVKRVIDLVGLFDLNTKKK